MAKKQDYDKAKLDKAIASMKPGEERRVRIAPGPYGKILLRKPMKSKRQSFDEVIRGNAGRPRAKTIRSKKMPK